MTPSIECIAFRAANWAVSPSRNVVRALLNNGIRVDTSVFKYGRREGIVSFDYSNAHSELVPWPVDEDDICRRNDAGKLVEVPIYCERRWIGAFLTPRPNSSRDDDPRAFRCRRLRPAAMQAVEASRAAKKLLKKLAMLTRRHAWKADFNQCTGRQLIGAH